MASTRNQMKHHYNATLFHLEAVDRIGSIPIVETSLKQVEGVYDKIKTTNRLFNWYFETAEATLLAAVESVQPAIRLFEGPLRRLDSIMCMSLDVIERRAPIVYMPPERIYSNTKEYMSHRLVKPVVQRADSMKQFRNAVLESPLTTYAADRIDGAFTVADKYVDKYLTVEGEADQVDAKTDEREVEDATNEKAAFKAIHHGQRFSRKLKRRLTQRTLAEARALKKQSQETIHVLLCAAELMVTDPKLAYQRATELWAMLSKDEPENQARPHTLEQLIVLLTRESARRAVHSVNYITSATSHVPKIIVNSAILLLHEMRVLIESLLNVADIQSKASDQSRNALKRAQMMYGFIQRFTTISLENLAFTLSGRGMPSKSSTNPNRYRNSGQHSQHNRSNNSSAEQNNANGVC